MPTPYELLTLDPAGGPMPMDDAIPLMEDAPPVDVEMPPPDEMMQEEEREELPIERLARWADIAQTRNIADELDEETLNQIGQRVVREYDIDVNSRSDWLNKSRKAMDLAMQIAAEKTSPWPRASNVIFPLMTTAAMQFAARAYPAIVQGRNVVKGVVLGKDEGVPLQLPPEMMQRLGMMQGQVQPGPAQMGMVQPGMGAPESSPAASMGHNGGPPMGPEQGAQQPMWIVKPGAKKERATKIGDHMSWQLLEEMPEWETETDKMLHILPIVGCTFRKSYYDPGHGCNCSVLVLAQNLVVNYGAKSMERAPRITELIELYPNEIAEQVRTGLFTDQRYDADGGMDDDDAPVEFLEQHRWLDLDDDGTSEPYIVTVHKKSAKVARIVARYDVDGIDADMREGAVVRIEPIHYYTKYDFLPNPDGGIYGIGFGQLLGPINEAVNTTLNQLFDAGSLQNAGGGFMGRGFSMHTGSLRFALGEWKQVNVPGPVLKDSIVPFNHQGPSPVLLQLCLALIEAGKEVAAVKDVLSGEAAAATMQPTTLMALIEQGLNVFTAIYKRFHRSLKAEFAKLYRLNRIYLQYNAGYRHGEEWRTITREDYERGAGVAPWSDPQMVSDMQRMAKVQLLQAYQNDPLCNGIEIRRIIFNEAQIERADELIIKEPPPNPMILQATAELEAENRKIDIQEATAKVTQIKDYTQALLNVAKAEEADAATALEYSAQWLKAIEVSLNALLAPAKEGERGGQQQEMPELEPEPMMPPMGGPPGYLQ